LPLSQQLESSRLSSLHTICSLKPFRATYVLRSTPAKLVPQLVRLQPKRLAQGVRHATWSGTQEIHDVVVFKKGRVHSPFLDKAPLNVCTADYALWTFTAEKPSEEGIGATAIINVQITFRSARRLGGCRAHPSCCLSLSLFLLVRLYNFIETRIGALREPFSQSSNQPGVVLTIELAF
jgi:hypothetical protein